MAEGVYATCETCGPLDEDEVLGHQEGAYRCLHCRALVGIVGTVLIYAPVRADAT